MDFNLAFEGSFFCSGTPSILPFSIGNCYNTGEKDNKIIQVINRRPLMKKESERQ